MKLAKKSKWNWKKRYFVLTPYHIAYYENDKANQKIKGEIRITADSQITSDIYDKKYGYRFIFSNEWESLTLSATTEADRSQWILTITSSIKHAESSLMSYALLLHPPPKPNPRSSGKLADLTVRKYFILANNLLTYHPDEQKTSEIEGLININDHTVLDEIDDDQRIISLIDSDPARSKVTFQFKAMNLGYESTSSQYQRWKAAIFSQTKPRYNQPATEVVPVDSGDSGAGKKNSRRRSKQLDDSPINVPTEEGEEEDFNVKNEEEEEEALPPLPTEEPPLSPMPPPPAESPLTTPRGTSRKVGFAKAFEAALAEADEPPAPAQGVEDDQNPPPRPSLSVRSPRKSTRGFDFNNEDEDDLEEFGVGDSNKFSDLRLETPDNDNSNAIRRSVLRRQSRSASPATTPRNHGNLTPNADKRGSQSPTTPGSGGRASSAGSLQRQSSFGLFRTASSAKLLDLPTGPCAACEVFRTVVSKVPLTKLLFDAYCKNSTQLDLNAIQLMCYEVGVYYSIMEMKISLKPYTGGSAQMNYDNFAKWWQYNPDFK